VKGLLEEGGRYRTGESGVAIGGWSCRGGLRRTLHGLATEAFECGWPFSMPCCGVGECASCRSDGGG